jgi:GAF domain-containing protein
MAAIPLLFIVFQVSFGFARQIRPAYESTTQTMGDLTRGSETIARSEVVRMLTENQAVYDKALVSIRLNLASMTALLFLVMVGLGVLLAMQFSPPFERMAVISAHLLQLIRSAYGSERVLDSKIEEIDDKTNDGEKGNKKEERVISLALSNSAKFIEEDVSKLKEDLNQRTDAIQQLSDRLLSLETFFHDKPDSQNVKQILNDLSRHIGQQFMCSHVKLYFVDESRQYVELQAAYHKEGDERGLSSRSNFDTDTRFHINEPELQGEGIVGLAAATGEILHSFDLLDRAPQAINFEVPASGVEIAVPFFVRGVVVGVLDVQSMLKEKFSPEEIALFHLYTDQLALVLENEQLQASKGLESERRTYSEITRQAWDGLVRGRSEWGYRSDEKGLYQVEGEWMPWMVQAVQQGQVVVWQDDTFSIASVPIRVRDYTIGVLDFRNQGEKGWTDDEISLIQTLTDQLGQALESARLYQNTQTRAERERILADITAKVRASTNLNVILQTAIRELAEVLRVPKGSIQLRGSGGDNPQYSNPSTSGGQDNA